MLVVQVWQLWLFIIFMVWHSNHCLCLLDSIMYFTQCVHLFPLVSYVAFPLNSYSSIFSQILITCYSLPFFSNNIFVLSLIFVKCGCILLQVISVVLTFNIYHKFLNLPMDEVAYIICVWLYVMFL